MAGSGAFMKGVSHVQVESSSRDFDFIGYGRLGGSCMVAMRPPIWTQQSGPHRSTKSLYSSSFARAGPRGDLSVEVKERGTLLSGNDHRHYTKYDRHGPEDHPGAKGDVLLELDPGGLQGWELDYQAEDRRRKDGNRDRRQQ